MSHTATRSSNSAAGAVLGSATRVKVPALRSPGLEHKILGWRIILHAWLRHLELFVGRSPHFMHHLFQRIEACRHICKENLLLYWREASLKRRRAGYLDGSDLYRRCAVYVLVSIRHTFAVGHNSPSNSDHQIAGQPQSKGFYRLSDKTA
jgi:hypothetical protein